MANLTLILLAAVLAGYAASLFLLARSDAAGTRAVRTAETFADYGPLVGIALVMAAAFLDASANPARDTDTLVARQPGLVLGSVACARAQPFCAGRRRG